MNEFLHSQAVTALLAVLAIYFAAKLLAVATKVWIPNHRRLTLDDKQLRNWRILTCAEALGMVAVWAGLLVALQLALSAGYIIAVVGVVLYAVVKWLLLKRYPYIDPATVRRATYENGKKVKKKKS